MYISEPLESCFTLHILHALAVSTPAGRPIEREIKMDRVTELKQTIANLRTWKCVCAWEGEDERAQRVLDGWITEAKTEIVELTK